MQNAYNRFIAHHIAADKHLSSGAKHVHNVLRFHRKTTVRNMAAIVGTYAETARRHLRQLEKLDWLYTFRRERSSDVFHAHRNSRHRAVPKTLDGKTATPRCSHSTPQRSPPVPDDKATMSQIRRLGPLPPTIPTRSTALRAKHHPGHRAKHCLGYFSSDASIKPWVFQVTFLLFVEKPLAFQQN